MNLLDLAVKITADDQATAKIGQIAGGITSGLGKAAAVGVGAMAAIGGATAATGKQFVDTLSDVAQYGDNIDKMSQKMGLSAEAYQEWDAVMQHSGTSMETMKASMKKLANAAETGNEAFQRIGLTQEQIASMSQEELFEATISGLQNVEDTTERTYLAGQLLGRGATELGALLNTSAEDTQAMRDRVHELGGVMSDESVKAAAKFQDSLQDLQTAFGGLKNRMMAEFLPAATTVMDGLQEVFAGNYDEGLDKIGQGVSDLASKFGEVLPKVAEVGGSILTTLAKAIADNAPAIIETIFGLMTTIGGAIIENVPVIIQAFTDSLPTLIQAIVDGIPQFIEALNTIIQTLLTSLVTMTPMIITGIVELLTGLVTVILDNLPMFLEAAIQLITQLLIAITEKAPEIIDSLITCILQLVDTIIANLPMFLEAAIQLILQIAIAIAERLPEIIESLMGALGQLVDTIIQYLPEFLAAAIEIVLALVEGIIESIPELVEGIGDLIGKGIDAIGDFLTDMINAGKDLIGGFIDGIIEGAAGLGDTLRENVGNAIDGFLGFLGIASPSKLFKEFGGYTMEGFALGIADAAGEAQKAMAAAADEVYGAAEGEVDMTANVISPSMNAQRGTQASAGGGLQIIVNIENFANNRLEDIETLSRQLGEFTAAELEFRGVAV